MCVFFLMPFPLALSSLSIPLRLRISASIDSSFSAFLLAFLRSASYVPQFSISPLPALHTPAATCKLNRLCSALQHSHCHILVYQKKMIAGPACAPPLRGESTIRAPPFSLLQCTNPAILAFMSRFSLPSI